MGSLDSSGSGKATPRKWSPEEDELLRVAVEFHDGRNWKAIAELVPGRNHVQCLQRWKKVLRPGLVKGHWTEREDKLLRRLVSEAPKNWGQVAAQIPGRTAKQCRERWCNHLDPRIKKSGWSAAEDAALLRLYSDVGQRWAAISKGLPGRTENAVKIRWKTLARIGGFDVEEDAVSGVSSRASGGTEVTSAKPADDEFVDASEYFKTAPPAPPSVKKPPPARRATAAPTPSPRPAPSPRMAAPAVKPPVAGPSPKAAHTGGGGRGKVTTPKAAPVDPNPGPPPRAFSSVAPPPTGKPPLGVSLTVSPEQRLAMQAAARHQAQQIAAANPSLDPRQLEQQIMAHIEAMHAQMARFGLPPLPPMPTDLPGLFPGAPPPGMFPPIPQGFYHPAHPQQQQAAQPQQAPQHPGYAPGRSFGYDSMSPMPPDAHMEFMDPQGMFTGMAGVDEYGKPGVLPIHPRAVSPWGWDKDFDSNPAYSGGGGGGGGMSLQGMMAAMHGGGGKPHSHEASELHQFLTGDMGGYVPDLGFDGLEHDALFSGRM